MPRPDTDELAPASLVDNTYRVVRLIGRGGMGTVYEAEDIRLGRPVALKVLRSDLARQLQADERFLQEARVSAAIQSPHVVRVTDVEAPPGGGAYLVMELLHGETLRRIEARQIPELQHGAAHSPERRAFDALADSLGLLGGVLHGVPAAALPFVVSQVQRVAAGAPVALPALLLLIAFQVPQFRSLFGALIGMVATPFLYLIGLLVR